MNEEAEGLCFRSLPAGPAPKNAAASAQSGLLSGLATVEFWMRSYPKEAMLRGLGHLHKVVETPLARSCSPQR